VGAVALLVRVTRPLLPVKVLVIGSNLSPVSMVVLVALSLQVLLTHALVEAVGVSVEWARLQVTP